MRKRKFKKRHKKVVAPPLTLADSGEGMLVLGDALDLTLEGLHDVLVPVPQQVLHNVRMRYHT